MNENLNLLINYYKQNPEEFGKKRLEYAAATGGGLASGFAAQRLLSAQRLPNPLGAIPMTLASMGTAYPVVDTYGLYRRLKNKEDIE